MDDSVVREKSDHQALVGSFHRFGPDGVAYEVLRIVDGEDAAIRVLETGETLNYPIKKIKVDPNA